MLAVNQLSYQYPGASSPALSGVTFQAERGRIVGLLGQNGAGKSTLVAHLGGLLPSQLDIRVDGKTIIQQRQQDPTRIAIAPQELAFYPILTVRENLECFAAVNGLHGSASNEAISRVTSDVQLNEHTTKRAMHLSGGLKRRLNLAIALLAKPELIVLDEPTVGVDAQTRAFLLARVKRLAHDGAAVLYATHYLEEVEAIADDVAILHRGRLLRYGPLSSLLEQGQGYVSLRFSQEPSTECLAQLASLGQVQLQGKQLRMQVAPGVSTPQVLQLLAACKTLIVQLQVGSASLEHLFMQLTHETDAAQSQEAVAC